MLLLLKSKGAAGGSWLTLCRGTDPEPVLQVMDAPAQKGAHTVPVLLFPPDIFCLTRPGQLLKRTKLYIWGSFACYIVNMASLGNTDLCRGRGEKKQKPWL